MLEAAGACTPRSAPPMALIAGGGRWVPRRHALDHFLACNRTPDHPGNVRLTLSSIRLPSGDQC